MNSLRIASRVFNTPLMIDATKAEVIGNIVLARLRGDDVIVEVEQNQAPLVTYAALGSPLQAFDSRAEAPREPLVGVVSIGGSLAHKASGMKAMSGIRSYDDIASEVEMLAEDPDIAGTLLRIDSPGGEVHGLFDASDRIHAAAQKKPLWALSEDSMMSAAYALGSQANKLLLTQSGMVGSIGVIMMHADLSEAEKKAGVKVTVMHRGARKADMNPHLPLTKDAKAVAEGLLDYYNEAFIRNVVRGRAGLTADAIREMEAGFFLGQEAIDVGLADEVASYGQTLLQFSSFLTQSSRKGNKIAVASASANSPREVTRVIDQEQIQADAKTAPVDLDELRKQVRLDALADASEVAATCELAGMSGMTVECIEQLAAGKPRVDVVNHIRKQKTTARTAAAADTHIDTGITADVNSRVPAGERYKGADLSTGAPSLRELRRKEVR